MKKMLVAICGCAIIAVCIVTITKFMKDKNSKDASDYMEYNLTTESSDEALLIDVDGIIDRDYSEMIPTNDIRIIEYFNAVEWLYTNECIDYISDLIEVDILVSSPKYYTFESSGNTYGVISLSINNSECLLHIYDDINEYHETVPQIKSIINVYNSEYPCIYFYNGVPNNSEQIYKAAYSYGLNNELFTTDYTGGDVITLHHCETGEDYIIEIK